MKHKRTHSTGQFPGEATEIYLRDIRKYTPLSREEEARLLAVARRGNQQALNRLITANLRFVVRIAGEYVGRGLPVSDLIAEGNMGLIRAAQTFEPERGHKFITYAVWWIRQAMRSALKRQTHPVAFPVNQLDDLETIIRTARELSQQLGRQPSLEEVIETTGMTSGRICRTMQLNQPPLPLDSPIYADGRCRYIDAFPAPEPGPDEQVYQNQVQRALRKCLRELPDREAQILNLYFGLETDRPEPMAQIGKRFHISRERVRQIKDQALDRLRRRMLQEKGLLLR